MEVLGVDAWIETLDNSVLLVIENFKSPGTVGLILMFYHLGGGGW